MSGHQHSWEKPHRGWRWCRTCPQRQFLSKVGWRDSMSLRQFAEKWLPYVAGPNPERMLRVDVALAFEFNSYESWDVVVRARFDFTDVIARQKQGLGTRVDILNGWQSRYCEDFGQIDVELEAFYKERTGRDYAIGDNTYREMRDLIQSPIGRAAPPTLKLEKP